MDKLVEFRNKIDLLDKQIVDLLNERAKVVVQVGEYKRTEKNAPPIYAPDRERAVLDKIKANNQGPLPDKCLMAVYRELMSGSFFLERPLRIGFLGPEGSYSHQASILKFGESVEYGPLPDIASVFNEVSRGHADFGLVPFENTIAGGVIETIDMLSDTDVTICAEMYLAIHHNLMAACSIDQVKRVYSKPEVLNQCRHWLSSTLPGVDVIQAASSAAAVQRVLKEEGSAAIGSTHASEIYGLKILVENVEDRANNVTRFFVIGKTSPKPTGKDKTAMVFSVQDKAGALVDVLQAFRYNDVNLTNLKSHASSRKNSEYFFFADALGHKDDENVKRAVEHASRQCTQFSIMGSFPISPEVY